MATIAEAFVAIARANGSTGSSDTIAGAIDLCTVALGGTVSTPHQEISEAVAGLGTALAALPAYVVSFDANTGTGSVSPMACAKGATITLPDGTGLTAPSQKKFKGWGTAADATTVITKLAATAATTLYAVWEASE